MKRILSLAIAGLFTMSVAASAATTATGTNTVAPTLQVSATVQSSVSLTLATGTKCAVATNGSTTDYKMDFGTVDAMALSNGGTNCGKFAPVTPGSTSAIYWSDYVLTPTWGNQAGTKGQITAQVTTNFAGGSALSVVRDTNNSATAPTVVTGFTAVSTGIPDTIVTNAASGTPITRYIGLAVAPTAAPNATAQTATVTFTLTVN